MILLVGIRDAAKQLSVSADTVRRKIRNGEMGTVRIGRRVLVPVAEIERICAEGAVLPVGTGGVGARRVHE